MRFGVLVRRSDGVWSNLAYAVDKPCWNMFCLLDCACDLDEVWEAASGVLSCSFASELELMGGAG